MKNRLAINLAIFGNVSVGKSTCTNALFVEQYADMRIKRTTALPHVYHEIGDKHTNSKEIRESSRKINNELMQKTIDTKLEYNEIKEVEYYVPRVFDLVKLRPEIFLSIFDYPGSNDGLSKEVYNKYMIDHFYQNDIVLLVLDINSGLNTSDDVELLTIIINHIKTNKTKFDIDTKLIILLNKCDDLVIDKSNIPSPNDEEMAEMVTQVKNIVTAKVREIYPGLTYTITCISFEDAYIYRMYKRDAKVKLDDKYLTKFGSNEYGKARWAKQSLERKQQLISKLFQKMDYDERIKSTGFKMFSQILTKYLDEESQYSYLLNHIKYDLNMITENNKYAINDELEKFHTVKLKLAQLNKIFDKADTKVFTDAFNKFLEGYNKNVVTTKINSVPADQSSFSILQTIKEAFMYLRTYFPNMWNKVQKDNDSIINNINQYYVNLLHDKKIKKEEMLRCFAELQRNNFNELAAEIVQILTTLWTYEDFSSATTYIKHDICINFMKLVQKEYKLSDQICVRGVMNNMTEIYKLRYVNEPVISTLEVQRAEKVYLSNYWNQVYIKTTNLFYEPVENIKRFFLLQNKDLVCSKECNLDFEKYIVVKLAEMYPQQLCTSNEIIDMVVTNSKLFAAKQPKIQENTKLIAGKQEKVHENDILPSVDLNEELSLSDEIDGEMLTDDESQDQ